jgi:hypothetical protein
MSMNDEIIINAILAGTREYLANAQLVSGANEEIAASVGGLADRIVVEVHNEPADINMDGKKVGNIVFKHYGVAVARA